MQLTKTLIVQKVESILEKRFSQLISVHKICTFRHILITLDITDL